MIFKCHSCIPLTDCAITILVNFWSIPIHYNLTLAYSAVVFHWIETTAEAAHDRPQLCGAILKSHVGPY